MKQELVDRAIDTAAKSIEQANNNAVSAETARQHAGFAIEVSQAQTSRIKEASLLTAATLSLLTSIIDLQEENNNLLRAIVAHTGAALPSSDDKADLFAQMTDTSDSRITSSEAVAT